MADNPGSFPIHQLNPEFPLPKLGAAQFEYQNPFWRIERISADFGDHSRDYFVSRDGVRAGVVVSSGPDVLLVRQYRLLINDYSFEIPGGAVEWQETPAEAAIRECWEETGIRLQRLVPLVRYQLALDSRDNPTHLFIAELSGQDKAQNLAKKANGESLGICWMPFEECLRMIFSGTIQDSFSVIGLLACHKYRIDSQQAMIT